MYQDLKKFYWWPGMKNDVANLVLLVLLVKNPRLNISDLEVC